MLNERLALMLDDSDRLMGPEVYPGMYSLLAEFIKALKEVIVLCV